MFSFSKPPFGDRFRELDVRATGATEKSQRVPSARRTLTRPAARRWSRSGARAGTRYVGPGRYRAADRVRPATSRGRTEPVKRPRDFRNRNKCVVITVGRRRLVNGRRPAVVRAWRRRGTRTRENVSSSFSPGGILWLYAASGPIVFTPRASARATHGKGRISSFYPIQTAASRAATWLKKQ